MKVLLNVKLYNGRYDCYMKMRCRITNICSRFVKPGATVAEFDKICEVQSDKASVEISSRYAGKIVKVHYNQNEIAKVGAPLVDIEVDDDSSEEATLTESSSDKSNHDLSKRSPYASTWETPSVRRLLHEYGLDITQVNGSGKHGRVLKGDVLSHVKRASLIKRGSVYLLFNTKKSEMLK